MSCTFCWDDFGESNTCYYRTNNNPDWTISKWCIICVNGYIATQHQAWIENVKNATCPKELQRLIDIGPPIWINDKSTFPVSDGDHIREFKHGDTVISARLHGAVEGEARDRLWDEMRAVMYTKAQEMNKKNGGGVSSLD